MFPGRVSAGAALPVRTVAQDAGEAPGETVAFPGRFPLPPEWREAPIRDGALPPGKHGRMLLRQGPDGIVQGLIRIKAVSRGLGESMPMVVATTVLELEGLALSFTAPTRFAPIGIAGEASNLTNAGAADFPAVLPGNPVPYHVVMAVAENPSWYFTFVLVGPNRGAEKAIAEDNLRAFNHVLASFVAN